MSNIQYGGQHMETNLSRSSLLMATLFFQHFWIHSTTPNADKKTLTRLYYNYFPDILSLKTIKLFSIECNL